METYGCLSPALKVALVRPRYDGDDPEFQEPLGAEAICGYLREHGVQARVFDRMLGAGYSEIASFNPDWIGFSLMTDADAPDALRMQQMLQQKGRRFFAGGLFITTCPEKARALFPSDTVMISGEGEGPVYELVTTGKVQGKLKPDPDEWAFASRDQLAEYLSRGGVINIRTSRGCKGNCAFCTTPQNGRPAGHKTRSTVKIADEMFQISQSGYEPVFNFTDDMFGDYKRIRDLTGALRIRGLRAAFSLEMRACEVINTPPGIWKELHEGGLCRIFTGLESLNHRTLETWKKPLNAERLIRAMQAMKQTGIACEAGYILWHDSTEPEDAFREAEQLYQYGLLSPKTALSRLVLFPGSRLYEEIKADDICLCRLKPASERMYARWETILFPLRAIWTAVSCAMPKMYCEAFLHHEKTREVKRLEMCDARIREMTWQALSKEMIPDEKSCEEIRGELIALHVAGA